MSSPDKEKILAIMKENSLHAYLATCDGDQPRIRPVAPIVEDDMSVWICTFSGSRKVKQLAQNPNISLAFVDKPNGERAATIIGQAEVVQDVDEKKRIWGLAGYDLARYFPGGPESKEFCLLKIKIDKVEWRESLTFDMNVYEPTGE